MGFGDFVSTSTERDVAAKETLLNEWEVITNHQHFLKEELFWQYQVLGMDDDDATMPFSNSAVLDPLLAFIILIPFTDNDMYKFIGVCVLSALSLALLGVAKVMIAGQSYALSAAITLFNSAIAGTAAYVIGWTLRNVAGLD
ncbi:hypothetical protein LguiB_010914 [Lonicera macranthoides]